MVSKLNGIAITGIAAAVSNNWTALADVSDEDPKVIEKFIKKVGVKGRYNAGLKQTTSDFCYAAARELLLHKHVSPDEIGVLVFVTQSPDYHLPATACVLQMRLGLSQNCIAFDVNLGCSGFTYGVNIVGSLLAQAGAKKGLLLCGDLSAKEKYPNRVEKHTHSATMLFGDSGTAALIEKQEGAMPINMISRTDGSGYDAIIAPYEQWRHPLVPSEKLYGTQMDDIAVFNFAVDSVPKAIHETMELSGREEKDYDCLALHQANLYILKQIAKRTGFPMEKTLISLDEFGNTSSASIPISLVKEYGTVNEDKQLRVMSCGFGVGLSWSTVDFDINTKDILPLIHTDEYFVDKFEEIK